MISNCHLVVSLLVCCLFFNIMFKNSLVLCMLLRNFYVEDAYYRCQLFIFSCTAFILIIGSTSAYVNMVPDVNMSNYEENGCLHYMFVRQAEKTPDKVAIKTADGKQVTFKELNTVTDILAQRLRVLGVKRNAVVGILMERCLEYSISYIAILKAGGAYLPIETSYPPSAVENVLEDAEPILILTKNEYQKRLCGSTVPLLLMDDGWLDLVKKENKKFPVPNVERVSLDDMAYTVYSSGTTGKPKGIQCPHRGAVFSYSWRHLAYPYEDDDREACNIFFVWEMLRPLLKGITMYIIPDTVIYDPIKLLKFVCDNEITRMMFTPSLIQTILDTQSSLVYQLKSLRQLWLCGEVVTISLRNRIAAALPWVKILNLYSISECHDVACSDLTNDDGLNGRAYCPVGKIFSGVDVFVIDSNCKVKQTGETGEIYVGGPALAIGYLNKPDLNSERFIETPAGLRHLTGPRLYKTGDLGYMLSGGCLEIIGRCDSMVKIRGYTVELKAIETMLNLPEVNKACVLSMGAEGSDKILVAYIVFNKGYTRNTSSLRSKLKKKLPFYMIPSKFVYLDKIPLMDATGKFNKTELPSVDSFNESDIIVDEKMTEVEQKVAKIWCSVLKVCSIDKDENFFDIGGHSLMAVLTIARINDEFRTDLSTVDLYANSTIESLANKILTGENSGVVNCVDLLQESEKLRIKNVPNFKLRTFWISANLLKDKYNRGNLFLTGVTGFLGSFVLKYLMQNTQYHVYCLVRSTKNESARDRLQNVLIQRNLPLTLLNTRIVIISGDISLTNFGLEEADYLAVCQDVDVVIHCAAYVNLVLPFNALYNINVTGTRNILHFCLKRKLKPLQYVSTSDVFPQGLKCCPEDTNINNVDGLSSGYSQTKWLAEQMVKSASNCGLPVVITRCGNIAGPYNDNVWNGNDMILMIIKSVILCGKAPDINWKIELTSVDFISEILVKLTQSVTETYGKTYNLINSNIVDSRILWDVLKNIGYKFELTTFDEWKNCVESVAKFHKEIVPVSQLLTSYLKNEEYLTNQSGFSQKNVTEFLSQLGKEYPRTNEHLLKRFLINMSKGGYIQSLHGITKFSNVLDSSLKGKVAFVTGASSGIGNAIARSLARAGVITVAVARRHDLLLSLKKDMQKENNDNIIPMKVDISDKKQVFACVSQVESTVGPIDILVNNAGFFQYEHIVNCDLDLWMEMANVHCVGFLNVLASVLKNMKIRQSGHIVNITSDAGRKAFPGLAVYSGFKFFKEALSSAMRLEIAELGIKVTCIQPGDVQTEGQQRAAVNFEAYSQYAYHVRPLQADDIANAVMFALHQSPNAAVNEILIEPLLGPV